MATIYNIGFTNSKPNANPKSGGAEIEIANTKTSFGQLAYEFYYSGELLDGLPQYVSNTKTDQNKTVINDTAVRNTAKLSASDSLA